MTDDMTGDLHSSESAAQPRRSRSTEPRLDGLELLLALVIKVAVPMVLVTFLLAVFWLWLESQTIYRLGFGTPLGDGRIVFPEGPRHMSAERWIHTGAIASLVVLLGYFHLRWRRLTRIAGLEPKNGWGYCRRIGFTAVALSLLAGSPYIVHWRWNWYQTHLTGKVVYRGSKTFFIPANDPDHPQEVPGTGHFDPPLAENQQYPPQ